jgi:undecaprenyl pyrophosphate phosphatase UppP
MGNETIVLQILDVIKGTSIGDWTNKLLLTLGGLASATIIYFVVMIYLQLKVNKRLKEQRADIDLLILLIHEQEKKINEIHKVLILEDKEKK